MLQHQSATENANYGADLTEVQHTCRPWCPSLCYWLHTRCGVSVILVGSLLRCCDVAPLGSPVQEIEHMTDEQKVMLVRLKEEARNAQEST